MDREIIMGKINMNSYEKCKYCNGTGTYKEYSDYKFECLSCEGTGKLKWIDNLLDTRNITRLIKTFMTKHKIIMNSGRKNK